MGAVVRVGNSYQECIYQDIWVKGKPVIRGARECEFRFEAIRGHLKKIKRPIKVLDIGANLGYFSLRLSEVFEGLFVMIEGQDTTAKALSTICKLNRRQNAVILNKRLNLQDLKELQSLERFDVVLALSIVHHFEEPYQEVYNQLTKLGNILIFEPPIFEENTINQSRIRREPIVIKEAHKLLIKVPCASAYRSSLQRKTFAITCQNSPLLPEDFNLKPETFKAFHGIYPANHII